MVITDKREIERRVKNVKLRAVHLKNRVLYLKKSTGVDLRDEIIAYLKDRFDENFEKRQRKLLKEKDKFISLDEI